MGTRHHLWVAFVVAVFAVLAGKALACSYFPPSDQADRQLLDAPVVFRGRVLTIRSSTSDDVQRQQVTLQLLERFKGSLESRVSARKETSLDSCSGVPVPHDFDGMFFAHRDGDGVLHLSGFFRAGTGPQFEPFNRLREERDAADALVRANPGQIEPLLSRARLLRRWRDHEEALIAYRAIADRAPQSIEAFAGIAQVLSAQNKPHEALIVLNEAEARLGPHPDFSAARGVARLVLGERDNLRQLDLRAADLRHIDLSGRDLRGVDFSGALLTAVSFRQSDLRGARFVGTRFDRVRMERANLEGAIFTAPIGFPHVEGANLSRARLDRVVLNRDRTLSLAYARLDGVNIVESRFGNIDFLQTRMRGANLATVFIYTGTMSETDFAGATLRDVTFGHFWMGDRSIQAQDLRGARLINVRFQGQ